MTKSQDIFTVELTRLLNENRDTEIGKAFFTDDISYVGVLNKKYKLAYRNFFNKFFAQSDDVGDYQIVFLGACQCFLLYNGSEKTLVVVGTRKASIERAKTSLFKLAALENWSIYKDYLLDEK